MRHHRAPLLCAVAICVGLALATTGCLHVHHGHGVERAGPPPWAPAHGHRHHHHGVVLVFDAGLGVYAVSGRPGLYFHGDHFLRLHAGSWQRALRPGGPWGVVTARSLPPGLEKKVAGKPGKHGRRR